MQHFLLKIKKKSVGKWSSSCSALQHKTIYVLLMQMEFIFHFSYFSHFYFSGVICITASLIMCLYVTCGDGEWPEFLHMIVAVMRYPAVESRYLVFK